jgi:CheY-like chemotaxis protein
MLGVILGCTQISLQKVDEGSSLWVNLNAIAKAAGRSRDITRQLLAFSRKEVISPRAVDLNLLIGETRKILARLIGEDIQLNFRPAPDLWTVHIDPTQFDQILMNLAVNARDAMPAGGRLDIETTNLRINGDYAHFHPDARAGEYVQVTISDSGQGMPPEVREHVFEPFFTTKGLGHGTGLGLATVHGVVSQNGGFINVYSEPGQGTVFRIYLPRQHVEAEAAEAENESPPLSALPGAGTILLVEDDDLLLWVTTEILQEMGYIVIQASTPLMALDICEKGEIPIDLVLTDVVMPEMNGKELVDRIKATGNRARIMFMSGYTADIVAQRGILEEGMSFIQKPINPQELSEKIKALLGRP